MPCGCSLKNTGEQIDKKKQTGLALDMARDRRLLRCVYIDGKKAALQRGDACCPGTRDSNYNAENVGQMVAG